MGAKPKFHINRNDDGTTTCEVILYTLYLFLTLSYAFSRSLYQEKQCIYLPKNTMAASMFFCQVSIRHGYLPCPTIFSSKSLQESFKRHRGTLSPLFDFHLTEKPGKGVLASLVENNSFFYGSNL
jgi:hypothetical protein